MERFGLHVYNVKKTIVFLTYDETGFGTFRRGIHGWNNSAVAQHLACTTSLFRMVSPSASLKRQDLPDLIVPAASVLRTRP